MSPCSRRWPASLSATSPPPATAVAAFVVAEQVRGGAVQLALARAGARAAATDPATATLARQVQELRQRQRAVWQQLNDTYGSPGVGGMRAAWPPSGRRGSRWMASWSRPRTAYSRPFPGMRSSPPRCRSRCRRCRRCSTRRGIISFFTLPDRVLVWLVRPGQAPVYRDMPIAKAALTAMVARVRRSLEQGPWQPFDVIEAHALYTLLLAPLRAQLTGVRHLLLVPDDVLLPLPFGVLVTEATGQALPAARRLGRAAHAAPPPRTSPLMPGWPGWPKTMR